MPSPEMAAKAEAHLAELETEILQCEAQKPLPNSMGAYYLEHLYAHRDLWRKYLGQ